MINISKDTKREFTPSGQEGEESPASFIFRPLTKRELLAFVEKISVSTESSIDIVLDSIVDWKNIAIDGEDLPFTRENLELLLDQADIALFNELSAFCMKMNNMQDDDAKN